MGTGGLTITSRLVRNRLLALEDQIEVLGHGGDLLLQVDELRGVDVGDVADGPGVLDALDAQELVDDDISLVVEQGLGDVLAVGQQAGGGEVQVNGLGLAVAQGELGLALGVERRAGDLDALGDLDVQLLELLLGDLGDVDGETVVAELGASGDQGDVLGLSVLEANLARSFNASWASAAKDDGVCGLDQVTVLVEDVLGGLVTLQRSLPWQIARGASASGEDQDIVGLLGLPSGSGDDHGLGLGVKAGGGAMDELEGVLGVLLEAWLDLLEDLGGVSMCGIYGIYGIYGILGRPGAYLITLLSSN